MAIIKKNNTQLQGNAPRPGAEAAARGGGQPASPRASYSEDTIEQGLVQDRRRSTDRRGYRRVEDRNLISQAEEEANAIRENARQEGFNEGLEAAQAELSALRETLADLLVSREDVLETVADDIGPLAVEIAEHIIKTEVTCDEELILHLVRDTLQKVGRSSKSVLVKVHPDDVPMVKHDLKENPMVDLKAELMVMDDPTVDRGSCIVETNSGLIDASFTTRLEILKKLFS